MKIRRYIYLLLIPLILFQSGCKHAPVEEEINGVKVINITSKKGLYEYPTWSPDGERIAIQLFPGNIWIANLDGSSWIKLIDKADGSLIWEKPEEITYVKGDPYKKFEIRNDIHTNNLTSKNDNIILRNLGTIYGLSWNPHNLDQLLVGTREANDFVVYLYDFGRNTKTKLNIKGTEPKWSPNGELIAYNGNDGIYIYHHSTEQIQRIYKTKIEGEIIESLSWSPDGRWIAYRGGPSKETNGIYVVACDGSGPPEQILNTGVSCLSWSPKEDKILFVTINAIHYNEIYIMDVPKKYRK